ncbi:proline-rich protein 36-like [Schistocerca piceifrons]|uniref:proline-rich protein 36-like n=1 Tax=Schistocerca piceifrons TaxID=274613 RepID=UPI001F5F5170|nr:proline-rich protein 36-like [Schistocerca piceifrons]
MSLLLLCERAFPGRPPTPSRSRISVDPLHVAATPLCASLPRAAADPQLLPYLCRPAARRCYSSVSEPSQGGRRPPVAPVSLSTRCTSLLLLCLRAFPGRPPTPSCSRISVDPLHVTATPLCASLLRAAADPQSLPYLCRPAARRCYSSVSEPSQGGRRPPVAPVSLSTRCMSLLLLCERAFPGRPPTPSRSRISVDLLHVAATPLAAADPQLLPYLCRPAACHCYSSVSEPSQGGRRPPVAPVSLSTRCMSLLLLCERAFPGRPPTPSRSRICVDLLHVAATPLAAADPQSLPYLCRPAARRCYSSVSEPSQGGRRPQSLPYLCRPAARRCYSSVNEPSQGGRRPPVAPVSLSTRCTSLLLLCERAFPGRPPTPSCSRISVDPLHVAATPLCASLLRAAADPQSLPYLCRPAARRCYSSVSEPSQGGRRPPVAPVSVLTHCTSPLLLCVQDFQGEPLTPSRSRISVDPLHVAATPLCASLPRAAADPQSLPYLCRPAARRCYSSVSEPSQGGRRPPVAPVSLSTCCTSLLLLCVRAFPGRPPTPSRSRISVDLLHVAATPLAAADPQLLPYLCRPAARRCYSSVSEPSQGGRRPPVAPVSLSTRCTSLLLLCVRAFSGRPPTRSRSRICVDLLHVVATPLAAADPQLLPYLCRPAARRCYSSVCEPSQGGRRPPVAPVSVSTCCTSLLLLCERAFPGRPLTPSRSRISVDLLHVAATPLAAADPQSLPYLCRPAARRCFSSVSEPSQGGRRPPVAPVSLSTRCTSLLLLCVRAFSGRPPTPSRSRICVDLLHVAATPLEPSQGGRRPPVAPVSVSTLHVAATPLCASLLRAAADPQSLPYLCRPAARRCYSSVSEPSQGGRRPPVAPGGRRPPVAPVSVLTHCTSPLLLCVQDFQGEPLTPSRSRISVDPLHVAATPLCASLLRAAADPQSLPYLCRPAARRCYSSVSEPSQGGRRPPVAPVSLSTRCMSLLLLCVRVFPGRPPTPSRSRICVDPLHVAATPLCARLPRGAADPQSLPYLCRPAARRCYSSVCEPSQGGR